MDYEMDKLKQILLAKLYYVTKPRLQLFKALQAGNESSIQELITALPDLDQATVYRNIALFEQLGIVKRLGYGWQAKFELGELFRHHHHHATCLQCGKTTILANDSSTEQAIEQLAKRHDFAIKSHSLEIQGLCADCQ